MTIHVDKYNGPFKVNIAKLFSSTIKFVSPAISPIPGSGNFNLPVSWINIVESSFTPVLSKHPRFKLLQLYVNFNLEYIQNHHFSLLYCWHFNLCHHNLLCKCTTWFPCSYSCSFCGLQTTLRKIQISFSYPLFTVI